MELQGVLEQVGAEQMGVGHTTQPNTNSVCNGIVYRIDMGMSDFYGGDIEVLEIIDGVEKVLVDPARFSHPLHHHVSWITRRSSAA